MRMRTEDGGIETFKSLESTNNLHVRDGREGGVCRKAIGIFGKNMLYCFV